MLPLKKYILYSYVHKCITPVCTICIQQSETLTLQLKDSTCAKYVTEPLNKQTEYPVTWACWPLVKTCPLCICGFD